MPATTLVSVEQLGFRPVWDRRGGSNQLLVASRALVQHAALAMHRRSLVLNNQAMAICYGRLYSVGSAGVARLRGLLSRSPLDLSRCGG